MVIYYANIGVYCLFILALGQKETCSDLILRHIVNIFHLYVSYKKKDTNYHGI